MHYHHINRTEAGEMRKGLFIDLKNNGPETFYDPKNFKKLALFPIIFGHSFSTLEWGQISVDNH